MDMLILVIFMFAVMFGFVVMLIKYLNLKRAIRSKYRTYRDGHMSLVKLKKFLESI